MTSVIRNINKMNPILGKTVGKNAIVNCIQAKNSNAIKINSVGVYKANLDAISEVVGLEDDEVMEDSNTWA